MLQYFFHGLAMRVDKGHAIARKNILQNHILDHRCLAHAGFPDNVHVPAAVILLNAKSHFLVPEVGFCEYIDSFLIQHKFRNYRGAIGNPGGGWILLTCTLSICWTLTSI